MSRVGTNGYVEWRQQRGSNGTVQWKSVQRIHYHGYACQLAAGTINFPEEYAGKRIRLKVEVVDDE